MLYRNNIPSFIKKHSGILLLCFLFFWAGASAQVNLVVDPSFELYDTCPSISTPNYGCRTWHSLDSTDNTNHATSSCSPWYLNECSTNPVNNIPNGYGQGYSFMYARTGKGMYATVFYCDPSPVTGNPFNNRGYLRGRLQQNLVAGKQYCGKFYVSLYKTQRFAVDRFGAYLDDGSLDVNDECHAIVVPPAFENPVGNVINDTIGWTRIEGSFIANGSEKYITIGNFYSNSNTIFHTFNSASAWPGGDYYVEDVSIISTEIKADGGPDQTICVGDSITLGRPQEIGLECQWFVPGNPVPFTNNSEFTFKATQTGTYTFVQRMDNCAITFDTVNITVALDCSQLTEIPNVFTPNEDGQNDTWSFTLKGATNLSYAIYNRWGNLIYQPERKGINTVLWDGRTSSGEKCSEGYYYYVIEYTDTAGQAQKKKGFINLFR